LLSASHRGKKLITGIYNYDILTNPVYSDAFFHTSIENRNFCFLKSTSETVEKIIYLGEPRVNPMSNAEIKKQLIEDLAHGADETDALDGLNQDKNDGGWLQAIQEDLEIEIEIED
jgi:hypothetical protein